MRTPDQDDLASAAERHYADAKELQERKRFDNAGYHYGFASECAVKHCLMKSGIKGRDENEVLWLHFPILRQTALAVAQGRGFQKLAALLRPDSYMQQWDLRMRYLKSKHIEQRHLQRWQEDSRKSIGTLLY